MSVLLDSNILISFFNQRDENHDNAVVLLNRVYAKEFGTPRLLDYVFDEFMTFMYSRYNDKKKLVEIGKKLFSSEIELIFSSPEDFHDAFELFGKTTGLSFTDCIIAVTALKQDIPLLSFDSGFQQVVGLKLINEN